MEVVEKFDGDDEQLVRFGYLNPEHRFSTDKCVDFIDSATTERSRLYAK